MLKFESCPDNVEVFKRMKQAILMSEVREKVATDFTTTLQQLGILEDTARALVMDILSFGKKGITDRLGFEKYTYALLSTSETSSGVPFLESMSSGMTNRAQIILDQLGPYIKNRDGALLDFGAGDGQVSQGMSDQYGRNVEALDVVSFPHESVRLPINIFDGNRIPREGLYYNDSVATNVLHHATNNGTCITELARLTRKRIILIETVPVGIDEEEIQMDTWRTFMNDMMWNSILKKPGTNIPIPGTYKTPKQWEKALEEIGFSCLASEDLGVDQPTIQDTHHLLVADR